MTATYTSERTCRPCTGTGVGDGWDEACPACGGSGEAAPDAPLRLRRSIVPESGTARPSEQQLDELARLIDEVHHRHPEHEWASALIGRTDATEAQVAGAIAALEPLITPTERPVRDITRRGELTTEAWSDLFHRSMTALREAQASGPDWRLPPNFHLPLKGTTS